MPILTNIFILYFDLDCNFIFVINFNLICRWWIDKIEFTLKIQLHELGQKFLLDLQKKDEQRSFFNLLPDKSFFKWIGPMQWAKVKPTKNVLDKQKSNDQQKRGKKYKFPTKVLSSQTKLISLLDFAASEKVFFLHFSHPKLSGNTK